MTSSIFNFSIAITFITMTLQLSTKEEEITITAEAIEEWSNILGTGTFLVPSGDSSYTISVVNYDGTIINYALNVNRPTSSYKFLDGIKINGVPLNTYYLKLSQ